MTIKEKIIIAIGKGYYCNSEGNVFSKRKKLSLTVSSKGYYNFSIRHEGNRINIPVHQFVAFSKYVYVFSKIDKVAYSNDGKVIFNDDIFIRHLDGNSLNNSWNNIELGTPSQNSRDIPESKRIEIAVNNSAKRRRFTDEEVLKILSDRKQGFSYSKLCKKYNTSRSTLSYLFNNAYYNHET